MCGVTAILSARPPGTLPAVVRELLPPMTGALAHRGPDGEGLWYGRQAALGHRRLAILDLTTGDQPMSDAEGRVQVVFNGEIYNHHALRAELEAAGCRFRTRSDTEVLVHGLRVWGRDLPARLLGMFAFVAHDAASGETLLARDHLGKKPLFFAPFGAPSADLWLIASEVRSFLGLPGFGARLDPEALRELLALRYVPGGRTLLANVHQVRPGHAVWHRAGEPIEDRPYWRLRFPDRRPASREEAVAEVRQLLRTCVADRLEADVPLGAFLSGGVDSSTVVAAMAQARRGVRAVTVGFEEAAFDERPYARELAQRLGVELVEEVLRPEPKRDLPALAEIFDLPQTDSSAWPTWLVCRAARRHVKVALSGDGGDETFGGYRRYRFDLLENALRPFLPRTPAAWLSRVVPKGDWLPRPLRFKRTLENLGRDPAAAYCRSVSALLPEEVDELLLPEAGPRIDPFRELRQVYARSEAPDHMRRILDLDRQTFLPGDILTKVDRCSMAVSLETRAPLLDRRLVELAGALPAEWTLDRRSGKKVLKDAAAPWVPKGWFDRPKMGFSIPLADWLRGPLRAARDAACTGAFARAFFQGEVLTRWAREHDRGWRDRSEGLWAVLVLDLWNERWGHVA
jgi:asparagine synthase (glutamine-hydrolysing)